MIHIAHKSRLRFVLNFILTCSFLFSSITCKTVSSNYSSCLESAKEKCLELSGAGYNVEYDGSCDKDVYLNILCSCLWGVKSCGENLSTEDLMLRISRAVELEYQLIKEDLESDTHFKDFHLPIEHLQVLEGKDFDTKGTSDAKKTPHNGVDLGAVLGTPVYASNSGIVKFAGFDADYGNMVIIDHGNGIETIYGHIDLNGVVVKEGDWVQGGTKIGSVGNTGASTGPHLHYELRKDGQPVDPKPIIMANMPLETKSKIDEKIRQSYEKEQNNNFASENFSTEKMLEIGNDIVTLNYTLPLEYENLSEAEKQEVTLTAAKKYAEINGFRDKETKNLDYKATVYAMESSLNVTPAEAYALYKMGIETDGEFRRSDIFKDFEDMYIPNNFDEPLSSSTEIGSAKDKLIFDQAELFDAEHAYPDGKAYSTSNIKFEKTYEQYLYKGTYYDTKQSEYYITLDVSKEELVGGSPILTKRSTLSIHTETIGTGEEAVDVQVMVFNDGYHPPYAFAVTKDPEQKYKDLETKKGVTKTNSNNEKIKVQGDKITVGNKTYYPVTETGNVGITYLNSLSLSFAQPININKNWIEGTPPAVCYANTCPWIDIEM